MSVTYRTTVTAVLVALVMAPAAFAKAAPKPAPQLPPLAAIIAYGVGHPFPVSCGSTGNGEWAGSTLFNGPTPVSITLSPSTCLMVAQPLTSRLAEGTAAFGLLIALHESSHVALASGDEAAVECRAITIFPAALHTLVPTLPAAVYSLMVTAAHQSDQRLPAAYHQAGCAAQWPMQ